MSIELAAYFNRIQYHGDTRPTLETLKALCLHHTQTIPFENLDVLLGRTIDLTPASVEQKLIHEKRGGYCFEQNSLLLEVLQQLGFDVRGVSARVRVQRPRDFTPPRTHLFAQVNLNGERWLADVGVGGLSPTAPLRLDTDHEQETPHDIRRVVREGGLLFHQVKLDNVWTDICEFTLEEMPPIDREVANWFTSTHPQSHFRNRLLVARAVAGGGRVSLLNRELTLRDGSGQTKKTPVESPKQLLEILAEHFGLCFPSETMFDCVALDWP